MSSYSKTWEKGLEEVIRSSDENLRILQNRHNIVSSVPSDQKLSMADLSPARTPTPKSALRRKSNDLDSKASAGHSVTSKSSRSKSVTISSGNAPIRSSSKSPLRTKSNISSTLHSQDLQSHTVAIEEDQQIQRKLDYLLKRTRKNEEAVTQLKSYIESSTKDFNETHGLTLHLSEIVKMDKQSISQLREQISNIKYKLDLNIQKESIRESNIMNRTESVPSYNNSHIDVGILSEQIFQRVHREFTSVVDSVVKSCMNDRMDHITKLGLPVSKVTNSNEGNNVEIDRLTKQLSALKRQVQLQDETIKDCQTNITTLKNNTQRMIQDALNQQMDQVRVVMESMTRKCNDVMMTSVNALRDELTHKYDNIIHQIMNSNNNNNKAIISYDERLNHMWNACENFDVSLKNVHDMAVDCQTELAQVISIARETQKHTDEIELNLLDKITHITNTTTNNNDMMNADQKDDIMKSCDELVHEQVNNLRKELTEYVSTTSDCVTAQNEKLQSFAVLLTESRQDSVTGMNKLAAAGRKQRDKIKEINEKLVRMGDMGITFDRVVNQIQQQDINMNNVILSLSTCQNELSDGLLALDNRLSEHVQHYQIGKEDATRQIDLRYDSLITSIHSIIETEIAKIKNDSRFMNANYVSCDISSIKPNKVNIDVLPTHILPSDTQASNNKDISNFEMNRSQISISNSVLSTESIPLGRLSKGVEEVPPQSHGSSLAVPFCSLPNLSRSNRSSESRMASSTALANTSSVDFDRTSAENITRRSSAISSNPQPNTTPNDTKLEDKQILSTYEETQPKDPAVLVAENHNQESDKEANHYVEVNNIPSLNEVNNGTDCLASTQSTINDKEIELTKALIDLHIKKENHRKMFIYRVNHDI